MVTGAKDGNACEARERALHLGKSGTVKCLSKGCGGTHYGTGCIQVTVASQSHAERKGVTGSIAALRITGTDLDSSCFFSVVSRIESICSREDEEWCRPALLLKSVVIRIVIISERVPVVCRVSAIDSFDFTGTAQHFGADEPASPALFERFLRSNLLRMCGEAWLVPYFVGNLHLRFTGFIEKTPIGTTAIITKMKWVMLIVCKRTASQHVRVTEDSAQLHNGREGNE
eukprot:6191199-Pleurochrysis_carterae.AAC.1